MSDIQRDYSTRDYEGFREDLIELLKQKMPEYRDFSKSDAGIVLIELLAHGLDILSYYNDVVANEVFLPTARERESVQRITRTLGYRMTPSSSAKFYQVFEIEPQSSEYVIPKGTKVFTRGGVAEESVIFETKEKLTIAAGDMGLEKLPSGEYKYKVVVVQGETINEEIVGTSDGSPDQTFMLANTPAIEESITLRVNEGFGFNRWTRVDDFIDSTSESRHFTVSITEQDEAVIQFGNNISGKIPSPFTNGIVATYRVGSGLQGNVVQETITEMEEKPAVVVQTFNPYDAIEPAREKESLASAKVRAVAQLRTLDRAVTIQDYMDLAYMKPFVVQANALWNDEEKRVDLLLLPEQGLLLTAKQITEIKKYYDARIMLGTKYELVPAETEPVDFQMYVKTYPEYRNSDVQGIIEGFVHGVFELGLRGFGEEVLLSSLVGEIRYIDQVRAIKITLPEDDVEISPYKIPVVGNLEVIVEGGIVNE